MARRKGSLPRRAAAVVALLAALSIGGATWTALASDNPVLRTIHLDVSGAAGQVLVDAPAGRVLVVGAASRGTLSILDARSGDLLRTVPLNLASHLLGPAGLAPRAGRLFVLDTIAAYNVSGDTVNVVDARTGALLRTVRIPVGPAAVAVDERSGHAFVASTGAMTATAGMDRVSMLDVRGGALLRTVAVPLGPGSAAMASDGAPGRVFVAGYASGAVSMLDARTGALLRMTKVGAHPSCIAVDEVRGRVFVGNEDSRSVSMLDARTGALLATTPVGFPIGLGVDPRAGRVIVANGGSGLVSILDSRSGAALRTLEVGGGPEAVAVDAGTGRAFVTSTGDNASVLIHRIGQGKLSWLNEWRSDNVTVLDTRGGNILRTIRAPATRDIAADEGSGRAFVADYGGDSVRMLDAAR